MIVKEIRDEELHGLRSAMEKGNFEAVYEQAVRNAIEITSKTVKEQEALYNREIISGISGRVKTAESIRRKLLKKGCKVNLQNAVTCLHDIAGMRATCYFLDDVYALAEQLKQNSRLHFLKEKNYIEKPKASGYKSLHLLMEAPVMVQGEERQIKVEIQLRTLAMDFWARLDHRLCYKKEIKAAKAVQKDLKEYADIISRVDVQMLTLRKRIDAL